MFVTAPPYKQCKQTDTHVGASCCTEGIHAGARSLKNRNHLNKQKKRSGPAPRLSYSMSLIMPGVIKRLPSAALFLVCIRSLSVKSAVT